MGRRSIGVEIAERYSEKIKLGLIQFEKTNRLYQMKTIKNLSLYQSGVVMNNDTSTITTLTYSESLELRMKNG